MIVRHRPEKGVHQRISQWRWRRDLWYVSRACAFSFSGSIRVARSALFPVGLNDHDFTLTNMLRGRTFLVPSHIAITRCAPLVLRRTLASSRDTGAASDDDLRAARSWLQGLHAEAIPLKSIGELSFSRSSGPGGQNVNKYDTRFGKNTHLAGALC